MGKCIAKVYLKENTVDSNESTVFFAGRGDRTRTCGLVVPNHARYQLRNTSVCMPG